MLQGLNLIASVAFQTHRGGVSGQCQLSDDDPGIGPAGEIAANRAYRCLVSGSLQTGAPAAVGLGRYQCLLGSGNDDVAVADVQYMWNVTDNIPGGGNMGWLKISRIGAALFEINLYRANGLSPLLIDFFGIDPQVPAWINVAFFRVDPA